MKKGITIELLKEELAIIPFYVQDHDSGMDVRCFANKIEEVNQLDGGDEIKVFESMVYPNGSGFLIPSGGRVIIPSGLKFAIPPGYEIQVRSRSGLAVKRGLVVSQGVGTIDSTYRGEIGICITNVSNTDQAIKWGERIAQLVLVKVEVIEWQMVTQLSETKRGEGGFGSTGTH